MIKTFLIIILSFTLLHIISTNKFLQSNLSIFISNKKSDNHIMIRTVLRTITKAALPHPWFDLDHHLMKPDPQIMNLMKYKEKIGDITKEESKDMSQEEYNTSPNQLYEVTREAYLLDPPMMDMLIKLYAHYNPMKIIMETKSLPGFNFNTRLQKLSVFDRNYTYQEMNDAKEIDSRYVISRFCPPSFKSLIDEVVTKLPIFGYVVPLEESQQYFELSAAIDKEIFTFFFGEGVFFNEQERHLYKKFLLLQVNTSTFLDNREIPFIDEAEDNFLLGMINWTGTDDHEFRCYYRPYFIEKDLEKEMWGFNDSSLVSRIFKKFWMNKYHKNPKAYANAVAINLIDRIKRYFISREFVYSFELPGSFVARNNLIMLHIWMINEKIRHLAFEIGEDISQYTLWQRLTNSEIRREVSSGNKVILMLTYISENLMKIFGRQTDKALLLLKIHPAQRKKIKTLCEKQAEQISYLLYNHFEKEKKSYENLDVLMQSIFYPQKQPLKNFPDFVFRIGEYVMKHREHLSQLTLDDIKKGNIDWDVMRIDDKVVDLMKKAREGDDKLEYPPSPLDEHDMQIIESLENLLPEEKKSKTAPVAKKDPLAEKYRPINH
ncbi:hypothetical protein SteCoe_4540 [Stentor coeruleus]|uniref:Uncharacterized protein n=1 Tax=Stentor coeruleus TaxID=5963 RepID=A0A1R2CUL0_9CILI|nr:hypothetical protein SteCoe_4540 [Stentor coeruleus]